MAVCIGVAVTLALAGPAIGAVRVVDPFPPERYAATGAVGLVVPGAGSTVTRQSALNALLTGRVKTSYLGGTPTGTPLIRLGQGPPPDVFVALPPSGKSENDRRYPIALVGGGAAGLLTSDSTRIDGLVSIADVATGRLRWVPSDDPVAALARLDARIDRNSRIHLPLTFLLIGAAGVVALVRPRSAPRLFLLALAGNLWLAGWWVVALLAAVALLLPLGAACATLIGAYLVVLGLHGEAVSLSPLGPSQAGRFYGFSNLLDTIFLVPALVGPALLGRKGVAVAAAALVAVGGSRFGADGGGLLVLLAGYAVLVARLGRSRLTLPRVLVAGAVLALVALALVGLDAALGGSSHVTDAVGAGPGRLLSDLSQRLRLSWARATGWWGPIVTALIGLGALVRVATRRPRVPVTDALLAAIAVSLLVNDTPNDVLCMGAAAAFVVSRWERDRSSDREVMSPVRVEADSRPRASWLDSARCAGRRS